MFIYISTIWFVCVYFFKKIVKFNNNNNGRRPVCMLIYYICMQYIYIICVNSSSGRLGINYGRDTLYAVAMTYVHDEIKKSRRHIGRTDRSDDLDDRRNPYKVAAADTYCKYTNRAVLLYFTLNV